MGTTIAVSKTIRNKVANADCFLSMLFTSFLNQQKHTVPCHCINDLRRNRPMFVVVESLEHKG